MQHLNEEGRESLRPKGSRIDHDLGCSRGQAAAHGRSDVLDADSILGLQRAAGNGAVTSLLEEERSPVHDVVTPGGRPLEPEVRTDMEARLGHDFSDVRVHDDSAAAASATAVNAHAYTVGSNVVFQRDKYDPSSHRGPDHPGPRTDPCRPAAQRTGGRHVGAGRHQGLRPVGPLRTRGRRQRRAGDGVAGRRCRPRRCRSRARGAAARGGGGSAAVQGLFVQREGEEEEEEPVQGLFVQREGEEEEEEEAPA